jgi:glycosyltransferase involved in cell wall biosynthesis
VAIKVLYLHHVSEISGAERSLQLLLRHLDRELVSPAFAGPVAGPFPAALSQGGIPVFPVEFGALRGLPAVGRAVRRLLTHIREHSVTLVHSNGPQTNVCGALAARLAGIPAVWHARNLIYGRMWDVDRMCAPLASRIICNSDAIRERFRGSRGWGRSITILNAVDTAEFHPGVPRAPFRREMGLEPDEVAVGIVGRIGLGKGHSEFVEAAGRILQAGLPARFFIVGDTVFPEDAWRRSELQGQVDRVGARQRLHFTGFRQDIPLIMRGLDIVVLASDAEPCGRVLFEAMASGTAIVATNAGGTPEIVRHDREGLLVPPRDPAALAGAIEALISDPARRTRLGEAGVARVRAEFTAERYVARTMEVYRSVLPSGVSHAERP